MTHQATNKTTAVIEELRRQTQLVQEAGQAKIDATLAEMLAALSSRTNGGQGDAQ